MLDPHSSGGTPCQTPTNGCDGGGIFNAGRLSIDSTSIVGNTTGAGGNGGAYDTWATRTHNHSPRASQSDYSS